MFGSRERNHRRNNPMVHSVLAVCALSEEKDFKGTSTIQWMDGVSTYLALTFGTLLSSQGTDASFDSLPGLSGRSLRCVHYFSGFPRRLKIEPFRSDFGTPKSAPEGDRASGVGA